MITEQQYKERCAEILRNNITFSHQIGDYVIHGALEALWKLHTEQTDVNPLVSGSVCPRCNGPMITLSGHKYCENECGWS